MYIKCMSKIKYLNFSVSLLIAVLFPICTTGNNLRTGIYTTGEPVDFLMS